MSNEHPRPSSAGTPAPSSDSTPIDPRTELARQRAASADAWRGYVETGAVLHRQRAQLLDDRNRELESHIHLADERETVARRELERLEQLNHQLSHELEQLEQLNQQLSHELAASPALPKEVPAEPSIRQLLKQRLRRSAPGRLMHTLVQYGRLLVPPGGGAPTIILPVEPPVAEPPVAEPPQQPAAPAPLMHLKPTDDATQRDKVLLITAQAGDTSTTRFVLDLVESLQTHCDVLVWHMGEGPLLPEFQTTAAGFMENRSARYDYELARRLTHELAGEAGEIGFAIVVGKETRSALPPLAELYIPSLALLHEPDAYATSIHVFQEIFFWAGHSCFTTPAALEQAKRICSYLNPKAASVLTPGPGKRSTPRLEEDHAAHHGALRHRLELDADAPPDAVILGWGALNYENGVDLFLACADMLVRGSPGKRYRFAWLAQPEHTFRDPTYGVSIQEQIQRMGLEDVVALIHEPMSLSAPASLADLVLLPARGEVLQHNGVEALRHGVPVVAFQNATALSRALEAHGLADSCLARPDDAVSLAARAAALLEDAGQRADLAARLRAIDPQGLTLDGYAQALLAKGRALKAQTAQERADEDTIVRSGELRPDYMGELVQYAGELECSPARLYLLGWQAGIGARKPRPGILPSLYAQAAMAPDSLEDPFAGYLRAGSPTGPWNYPVVAPADSLPLPGPEFRVALHIHAYYPDMLHEILERLDRNVTRPDLFISVKDAAAQSQAARILETYQGSVQAIEIVPNRGRDIGPFLSSFGPALVQGYELIGHVHTKRSEHADRQAVEKWRHFLLENTLGGEAGGAMLDNIVCRMSENPSWGVLFPDEPVPFAWDSNRACAQALAERMAVGEPPDHFCFPAGTMFWIRAAALRPFVELGLQYDDYPIEPLPIDGSLLHAIERLFGAVPRMLGMECALTTVPGLSR